MQSWRSGNGMQWGRREVYKNVVLQRMGARSLRSQSVGGRWARARTANEKWKVNYCVLIQLIIIIIILL